MVQRMPDHLATHPSDDRRTGLLLVAHGTRERRGLADARTLTEQVRLRCADLAIELGFLELAEPTIVGGVDRLVEQGIRKLTVVPLLLLAAAHAKRDIPSAIAEATAKHPTVEIRLADNLGSHPAMIDLSTRRLHESLRKQGDMDNAQCAVLLVGRGTRDESAIDELRQYGQQLQRHSGVARVEIAFLAMAQPDLRRGRDALNSSPYSTCIVQPHLLLRGVLLDRLRADFAALFRSDENRQWLMTKHLGSEPEVVDAILSLAGAATQRLAR